MSARARDHHDMTTREHEYYWREAEAQIAAEDAAVPRGEPSAGGGVADAR